MDIDQRAARARNLKDDEIFREVIDGLRAAAIASWMQTKVDDTRQRDFSWMMVKTIDRIEAYLQGLIDDQTLTAHGAVRAPE